MDRFVLFFAFILFFMVIIYEDVTAYSDSNLTYKSLHPNFALSSTFFLTQEVLNQYLFNELTKYHLVPQI